LLNSLNPITITFFAVLILNEKLTLKKVFGLVLAVIGINFIIGESQGNNILGISFSLMSVILWSIVSVMVRKISPKYDSLQLTYYGCGIATLCYLPLGISEQLSNFVNGKMQLGDFYAWLAIIYIGVICTGIAHYLWNYSLSTLEATVCSSFYPIQPLVSTILATWLLDESIQLSFLVGALLIITGILISLRKDVNFEGTLIE
jgi:drug/metabolite transporter (DMT)-like permease